MLNYLKTLFDYEKGYIRNAGETLDRYIEFFGDEFIVSMILEGIVKNIKSYYPDSEIEYYELNSLAEQIVLDMSKYIRDINREYGVSFKISKYLEKTFL